MKTARARVVSKIPLGPMIGDIKAAKKVRTPRERSSASIVRVSSRGGRGAAEAATVDVVVFVTNSMVLVVVGASEEVVVGGGGVLPLASDVEVGSVTVVEVCPLTFEDQFKV